MSVSIVNRKQMILESLVKILEEEKIGKITTKVIAYLGHLMGFEF